MASDWKRPSRIAAVLACALGLAALPAHAEPSAADKETARALLDQGDKKLAAGDVAGALAAYQGAHQIMGVPTTGIELAKAQEKLGKLVEARDTALSVTRFPKADNEPAPFTRARAAAEELAAKLAPRIPSIHVTPSGPPAGATIKVAIDGAMLTAAAATLPRKVNPGPHHVVVGADGFTDATKDVTVAEGENAEIAITLTPGASSMGAAPAESAAPTSTAPSAPPPPPKERMSTLVPVGLVVAGVGVVAGSVTGVISLSKASSAKKHCTGDDCQPAAKSDIDSSKTFANVSNVGFGVAIVGAAITVVGLVKGGGTSEARDERGVHAGFGLGSVALSGRF